jgi:hypothetical protein
MKSEERSVNILRLNSTGLLGKWKPKESCHQSEDGRVKNGDSEFGFPPCRQASCRSASVFRPHFAPKTHELVAAISVGEPARMLNHDQLST